MKTWEEDNTLKLTEKEDKYFISTVDSICSKLLESSAETRSEYISDLHTCRLTVIDHLLKIFYFRDFNQYLPGWITTCYKYFSNPVKLKATNKYPKKELVFRCLWGDYEDTFSEYHKSIVDNFNKYYDELPTINANEEAAKDFCEEYFMWVSFMIENYGKVELEEVDLKILELLKRNSIYEMGR